MKTDPINRLPGYDRSTSRSESAAFLSLGVVGAALITAAVSNAINFARQRECVTAAPFTADHAGPARVTSRTRQDTVWTNLEPSSPLNSATSDTSTGVRGPG